jgi:hypothetical protein
VRQPIGEPPSGHVGETGEEKRQCGKRAARQRRKPEFLDEIRGQPGEIEIQSVAECEIHRADGVEIARCEQQLPRHRFERQRRASRLRRNGIGAKVLLNPGQLARRHRRVILRAIAVPCPPGNRPGDAGEAEDDE